MKSEQFLRALVLSVRLLSAKLFYMIWIDPWEGVKQKITVVHLQTSLLEDSHACSVCPQLFYMCTSTHGLGYSGEVVPSPFDMCAQLFSRYTDHFTTP